MVYSTNTTAVLLTLVQNIVIDIYLLFVCLMLFNTTFNNISVISVLLVDEARVPSENHPPVASH